MKSLTSIAPTPEQLKIITDYKAGPLVVRGAAGSGKTTTALLRLKFLKTIWARRKKLLALPDPVRILVLTFNRTLRGYVKALIEDQVKASPDVQIEVLTAAKWAMSRLGHPELVDNSAQTKVIGTLSPGLPFSANFLASEVQYVMGRYLPGDLSKYLTAKRGGRGASPVVEASARAKILDVVIPNYNAWKKKVGLVDWNDISVQLATTDPAIRYDVVVIDEAQDFAANQIRAIQNHLQPEHSVTFVLDSAQRIYPRFFGWSEVVLVINNSNMKRLERNHRNTKQVAALARSIIGNLQVDDDGTLPDLKSSTKTGPLPLLLTGKYSDQVAYALNYLGSNVDLAEESVAFLHPLAGGWLDYLRGRLANANRPWVELTRDPEWPEGPENIALSTLHSVKGLEFDHVIVLGLNDQVTPHGAEEGDDQLEVLRRLLAMAVGRARKMVVLGYKPGEASDLIEFIDPGTVSVVDV